MSISESEIPNLVAQIERSISPRLFLEDREDIKQSVLVRLLAGESMEDLSEIISAEVERVQAQRKESRHRLVDLDTPVSKGRANGRTIGESISEQSALSVLSPEDLARWGAVRRERERMAEREQEEDKAARIIANAVETDAELEAEGRRIVAADRAAREKNKVRQISSSKRWRQQRRATCEACGVYLIHRDLRCVRSNTWECPKCEKGVRVLPDRLLHGFLLSNEKTELAIHLLAEGLGVRATSRVLHINTRTVMSLHKTVGQMCSDYLTRRVVGIAASDVEVDEVWTFVFKKDFNKKDLEKKNHKIGSAWIYVGLDRATKMVLAYHVGRRTTEDACEFMKKLRAATSGQMTVYTDGFQPYPTAVYSAFLYGNKLEALPDFLDRPAVVVRNNGETGMLHQTDAVDYARACTNQVEKFNSTLRNGLKRMARRSTAHSKSLLALENAIAVFMAYYNFCKFHSAIQIHDLEGPIYQTPAMAAGLADHRWSVRELITQMQQFRESRLQQEQSAVNDPSEVTMAG